MNSNSILGAQSYEMVWEDPSPEAAAWVRSEFDWLWKKGVPLTGTFFQNESAAKVLLTNREAKTRPINLESGLRRWQILSFSSSGQIRLTNWTGGQWHLKSRCKTSLSEIWNHF